MGIFNKIRESLSKTRDSINDKLETVIQTFKTVDEELFEELEEALITADLGVNTSLEIIDRLRQAASDKHITNSEALKGELAQILKDILKEGSSSALNVYGLPAVIMVIGVNGVGKTTSIGKIASMYRKQGKEVVIAAADTFRAAAIEQLEVWAERAGVRIIKQQEGADPAAVVYDAINACKGKYVDVLLCDTAGRLHNKKNLMEELKKIHRILERELPMGGKEILLVLDATTGQNAVQQAKEFKEAADITGIMLTKLDGTAKGGIVFAIKNEFDIPVKLVGLGEGTDDIALFDPDEFVNGILDLPDVE